MYKEALRVLLKAKNMKGFPTEVFNMIGLCYRNLGNFLESEKYLILAAKENFYYLTHISHLKRNYPDYNSA